MKLRDLHLLDVLIVAWTDCAPTVELIVECDSDCVRALDLLSQPREFPINNLDDGLQILRNLGPLKIDPEQLDWIARSMAEFKMVRIGESGRPYRADSDDQEKPKKAPRKTPRKTLPKGPVS